MLEIQGGFNASDAAVGGLEHGDVKALLASEVVVNHPLAGLGAGGDTVHARTADPLAGELLRRDLDDIAFGALGIVDPLAARPWAVKGVLLHVAGFCAVCPTAPVDRACDEPSKGDDARDRRRAAIAKGGSVRSVRLVSPAR